VQVCPAVAGRSARKGSVTAPRRRLDAELVRRGLVASREQARQAVLAGQVLVGGVSADKPDRQILPGEPIVILGPAPRFVGRGGLKLDAALDRFAIDVTGRRAIDVGASTGGFTDCLLTRGAVEVVAIDVGYGQLHERLRADPRVHSHERTNVRQVDVAALGGVGAIVVVDVSFISLGTVAPALLSLLGSEGDLVALVKPQFEAGRAEVSRGRGVVRDPVIWRRVLAEVRDTLRGLGAAMMGVMVSPITGVSGNVEFLAHVRRDGDACSDEELDAVVATAGSTR
jgi:23S rRNA (cytidine1920-2'-O)/16S rRNA (cytidine1409-2'-O)-methyltransferase